MTYPAYKLVDCDGYTRRWQTGHTLWLPVGTTITPIGKGGAPCGPGVLHGYISPEVAVLGNPIHACIHSPRLLRIASDRPWKTDGLKRWTVGTCTVLEELPLPVLTTAELVAWAVVVAPHVTTRAWAVRWLDGTDRSGAAAAWAWAAADAARAAATDAAWASGQRTCASARCRSESANTAEAAAWAAKAAAATAATAATAAADSAARAGAEAAAKAAAVWAADAAEREAAWWAESAEQEKRLMPALARARAILSQQFPAERYDEPLEVPE